MQSLFRLTCACVLVLEGFHAESVKSEHGSPASQPNMEVPLVGLMDPMQSAASSYSKNLSFHAGITTSDDYVLRFPDGNCPTRSDVFTAFIYRVTGYSQQQNIYGSNDYSMGGYDASPQNYGFDCYGKAPALYGDGNYDCRIFHVCQADGRQDTLRCPKQTRFNNYLGVCDWESKIDRSCMPLYKEEYTSNYGANYEQGPGGYDGLQGTSIPQTPNYPPRGQYRRK